MTTITPSGFVNQSNLSARLSQSSIQSAPVPGQIRIPRTPNPSQADSYNSFIGQRGRPILFQVVDPSNRPIWQFLLAMHVNPKTFSEKFSKSKNVVMTYGGFVEFVWPDELDSISAEGSTGGFVGPLIGLTAGSDGIGSNTAGVDTRPGASGRKGTLAWERQEDLLDLFRQNGLVFDGNGIPIIRGKVMCIYDRGIYLGSFRTFSPKEDDTHNFSFELSWEFKVEAVIYRFPGSQNELSQGASTAMIDGMQVQPPPGGMAPSPFQVPAGETNFINGPPVAAPSSFNTFTPER
jgi:hypothetical protein